MFSSIVPFKRVGEGAHGSVWLGVWKREGRDYPVAVKRLGIRGDLQQQMEEAQILMKFQHPNIMRVFSTDYSKEKNYLCIVMEYISGGSLFELLHSEFAIDWDTKIRLAYQAAISVHALHSHNPPVLHRDIKSLNFMIAQDCTSVKLVDFGLALDNWIASPPSEPDEKAVGTVRWEAPETFTTPVKWTPKVDIYSLGITFYEIATRKIPFEEIEDLSRVVHIVKRLKKRPPLPADCPKDFAQLIEECWAHDPDARPSSLQLVAKLNAILSDRNLIATTDPIPTLMAFNYYHNELYNVSACDLADKVSTVVWPEENENKGKQWIKPMSICWNPNNDCFYFSGVHIIKQFTNEGEISIFVEDNRIELQAAVVHHKENAIYGVAWILNSVLRIDNSGEISVFAGGTQGSCDGQGTQAQFDKPLGIAIDQKNGILFVSDADNQVIRRIDMQGNVTTLGKRGPFTSIGRLCFDETTQSLFVCDFFAHNIKQVLLTGEICAEFRIPLPGAITVNAEGSLFVSSVETHSIYLIKKLKFGKFKIMLLAGTGEAGTKDGNSIESSFSLPFGLVFHEHTNSLYVVEAERGTVRRITLL